MKNKDKWQWYGKHVVYNLYAYSLDKYILGAYYMPGFVLEDGIEQ